MNLLAKSAILFSYESSDDLHHGLNTSRAAGTGSPGCIQEVARAGVVHMQHALLLPQSAALLCFLQNIASRYQHCVWMPFHASAKEMNHSYCI